MDFSTCQISYKGYRGSDEKRYQGGDWQLQEFLELEKSIINSSDRGRTPYLENTEFVLNSHPEPLSD